MFVIGITGAVLVFRDEFEYRANTTLYQPAPPGGPKPPMIDVITSIQTAYPDHRVASVYAPTRSRPVYFAFVEKDGQHRNVLASAASGHVLGERPTDGFLHWVQDLHVNLLGGRTGRVINAVGATLLLLLCVTGSIVWWPGVESWRRRTKVDLRKGWRRLTWELHGAVGFWTVAVLMMWAVTAVYFAFPQPFQRIIGRLSPLTSGAPASSDPSMKERGRVDVGPLLERAEKALPGGQIAAIVLPASARSTIVVQVSRAEPNHIDNTGYVHFTFDQYSGALLNTWDQFNRSTGDAVLSWMAPLHFGNFGGVGVRILWTLLGLGPPLLVVTSVVMWWNRVLSKRWD